MVALKSALLALATFAVLLPALAVVWAILLGPVLEPVWPRLPDGWDTALGAALLGLAVLSGLAIYAVALARILRGALGLTPAAARLHVATVGAVPPALALGAAWLVVANLRFGW